jgi:hypothetical protein
VTTLIAQNPVRDDSSRAFSREYLAFGGILRAEIEFPELTPTPAARQPDWTVSVRYCEPPRQHLTLVGERSVREEHYQLFSFPGGFRLVYSHAGAFDVSGDGSSIYWYHYDSALPELVRSIILGPAISLALELAGFFCLHGSAVALGDQAVAFVGPKHFGKSTLAAALTAAGGRLVSDDLLAVRPGSPAIVRPGIGSVRLWSDMATALPLDGVCDTLIPGVKTTATGFAEAALAATPTRLGAIYVLSPVAKEMDGRVVWRQPLAPSEAAMALALQTKLPACLVGLRAAGSQLRAAATVAATVPVWTLHAVRDVGRLDALVRQVIEWSQVE